MATQYVHFFADNQRTQLSDRKTSPQMSFRDACHPVRQDTIRISPQSGSRGRRNLEILQHGSVTDLIKQGDLPSQVSRVQLRIYCLGSPQEHR